jgi:cephalosporin hydroxylase
MRPNYNGLKELVETIQKTHDTKKFSIIEIGSYSGQSSAFFAKFFDRIISIDPFINEYDPLDPACKFMPLESVYSQFLNNISKYSNITHIKKTSDEAIKNLNNEENILAVYIDGLHTFDQVKKDIENYKDIIIKGGYLCGHDYHTQQWPGVCNAIDEFKKPDAIFSDTSWLIRM